MEQLIIHPETLDPRPRHSLMDLPPELHILISSYLPYPDALALKHTCRQFNSLVYTGVHLKVDWLVERFERKLECPMEKCSFRTDESFCNSRIRRIMERRRWHLECRRVAGGCLVIEGRTCQTDFMPSWLKRQGPRKVTRTLSAWGREGGLLRSEIVLWSTDFEALLQASLFVSSRSSWKLCGTLFEVNVAPIPSLVGR